jgi:hypothetical protein
MPLPTTTTSTPPPAKLLLLINDDDDDDNINNKELHLLLMYSNLSSCSVILITQCNICSLGCITYKIMPVIKSAMLITEIKVKDL